MNVLDEELDMEKLTDRKRKTLGVQWGAVAACLLGGEAQLGVGGPVIGDHPELEMQRIGSVELVPVAAPDHPLARRGVLPGEAREHLQLILSDRSDLSTANSRCWGAIAGGWAIWAPSTS